jgi:hypothetical protein
MQDLYFTIQHQRVATPLFNIEPRGAGTSQVQSLFDYIKTLAMAHRLSLPSILELLFGLLGKKLGDSRARNNNGRRCQGITDMAQMLVDASTRATGRDDLVFTTMLPFAGHLSANFLISDPRFCPVCFSETPEGQLPYTRLLWCLQPVQCCPIHKVKLVLPVCGAESKFGGSRVTTEGVCSKCGAIGHHCNRAKPKKASDTDVWVANQVADLLNRAKEVQQALPQSARGFLRAYCDRPGLSINRVATRSGVGTLSHYLLDRNQTMELTAFLKIASSEGLSLVGLLKGTGESTTPPPRCVLTPRRVVVRERDWKAIGTAADAALLSGHSLCSWARELGIHPRSLSKRLPEECARLARATEDRKHTARLDLTRRHVLEVEAIADGRWAQKRCVTPLRKYDGKRLNGDRPLLLRALGVLLSGGDVNGAWGPEIDQTLREAAKRIALRHGTDTPC